MPPTNHSALKPFEEDPDATFLANFKNLAITQKWKPGSRTYQSELLAAVKTEFAAHLGYNVSKLDSWQAMCRAVGLSPEDVPRTITQCEKYLRTVNVNIFDLIEALRDGGAARTFKNSAELARYTVKKGKVFPREKAKGSEFLKVMLKVLF